MAALSLRISDGFPVINKVEKVLKVATAGTLGISQASEDGSFQKKNDFLKAWKPSIFLWMEMVKHPCFI